MHTEHLFDRILDRINEIEGIDKLFCCKEHALAWSIRVVILGKLVELVDDRHIQEIIKENSCLDCGIVLDPLKE